MTKHMDERNAERMETAARQIAKLPEHDAAMVAIGIVARIAGILSYPHLKPDPFTRERIVEAVDSAISDQTDNQ